MYHCLDTSPTPPLLPSMASCYSSCSQLPSPFLHLSSLHHNSFLDSPRLLFFLSSPTHYRRLVCSATAGGKDAFVEEERKREALERYGLDPMDFGPKSSTRLGRREGRQKGRNWSDKPLTHEKPKPPRTTHRLLHVLGGKARRKKLLSPKGMDVRPMMELVRGAAFDIIQVAGGCPASLRPGRWLDLYSGTGSVGIEAISRGCLEAHFVEMDPWVVSEVLRPNLEWTGFLDVSVIHMTRVENFLQHAEQSLVYTGGAGSFDYISVTPPYTAVDYSMLMGLLEKSPLVGEDTFILVEYPLKTVMSDTCGALIKIADRRFGRTHLAIYGPKWAEKKKKPESFGMKTSSSIQILV